MQIQGANRPAKLTAYRRAILASGQALASNTPLWVSVVRGLLLLFGISTSALPSWDQKSEAVQSDSWSDNMCCRNWTHCELVSPFVPKDTFPPVVKLLLLS